MKRLTSYEGIWPAIWTPLDNQGNLLKEDVKRHLSFLKTVGIKGILVAGSTGEFPRFSIEMRQTLLEFVCEQSQGLEILFNVSDMRLDNIRSLIDYSRTLPIAGILALPPFYYPTTQNDLIAYFSQLTDWAQGPLFLYNYPECARNTIEAETVERLVEHVPILGVKQSAKNFETHRAMIEVGKRKGFPVFSLDTHLEEAIYLGAAGAMSGLANTIPELLIEEYESAKKNLSCTAVQETIKAILQIISPLPFPLNVAVLMEARGFKTGSFKAILSKETKETYQNVLLLARPFFTSDSISQDR